MRPLVVFDIDGTLTNTNAVDDECFVRAVGAVLGVDSAALDWSAAPHVTDTGLLRWLCEAHCGRPPRATEAAEILDCFLDLLRAELAAAPTRFRPVPGARSVLPALRTAGWDLALATGGWEPCARLKLQAAGIDHTEVPLASSSDASTRTEIIQMAVRRASQGAEAAFSRVVSVGDGRWDVRAAADLSLPFVGIANGTGAESLRAEGAAHVLPDLADVDALVAALSAARVPRPSAAGSRRR